MYATSYIHHYFHIICIDWVIWNNIIEFNCQYRQYFFPCMMMNKLPLYICYTKVETNRLLGQNRPKLVSSSQHELSNLGRLRISNRFISTWAASWTLCLLKTWIFFCIIFFYLLKNENRIFSENTNGFTVTFLSYLCHVTQSLNSENISNETKTTTDKSGKITEKMEKNRTYFNILYV